MGKKWIYSIIIVLLILGIGKLLYTPTNSLIYEFNESRDTKDILKLMHDNWYWLISSPDYRAGLMLSKRTPSHKEPQYFGKLVIKVLRNKDDLIGFVTYYKKSEYQGHLFILAVDKRYRGKGYAQQLTQHAIKELKNMGAQWVQLVTREANTAARSLYIKLGFTEYLIEDGFVYYRTSLT
jgi:ribosomal protein S18 acetylase RimI-like enzyme